MKKFIIFFSVIFIVIGMIAYSILASAEMGVNIISQDGQEDQINETSDSQNDQMGVRILSTDNKRELYLPGSILQFGRYEQDNNLSNGEEPIQWKVVDARGSKRLLVSVFAIDSMPFNPWYDKTDWSICELRSWLNYDFFYNSFTSEEQGCILRTKVTLTYDSYYGKDRLTPVRTGFISEDDVFLLSNEEVGRYFHSPSDRTVMPTDYAKAKGLGTSDSGRCSWWLRTVNPNYLYSAEICYCDGTIKGGFYTGEYFGVRPAIWIDMGRDYNVEEQQEPVDLESIQADGAFELHEGDTIFFGNYEQDNNKDNGTEPISWRVMKAEGTKCLLLSRYILDYRAYNENEDKSNSWESSTLREWLNSEFYFNAFSNLERDLIMPQEIDNSQVPKISYYGYDIAGVAGEENTYDSVFLFGFSDIGYQDRCFDFTSDWVSYPTPYALYGDDSGSVDETSSWWLRTPGETNKTSYISWDEGIPEYMGTDVGDELGVRPAIWVDFSIQPNYQGDSDYAYAILEDNTIKITKCYVDEESIEIPGIINKHIVSAIADGAFSDCAKLNSINIPDSVITIGSNPFLWCEQLTEIQVSQSHPYFEVIDGVLFNKAEKRLITYPCALTNESYSIPQGVEGIGENAFSGCKYLTSVFIPNSVNTIGNGAFFGCNNLTSIIIPDNVSQIADEAFSGCYSLTDITIPDSVTSIGNSAFYSCESLATVTIPQSVAYIGNDAFNGCISLTSVSIPEGITEISDNMFCNCTKLKSVNIPDSVIAIGFQAFSYCEQLESIIIPISVTTIGDWAFSDCNNLKSLILSDNITSIGDNAFSDCENIEEFIVGRNSYAEQFCFAQNIPYRYSDSSIDGYNNDGDNSDSEPEDTRYYESRDYICTILEGGALEIIGYRGHKTKGFTFPSQIDGHAVLSIGADAFSYFDNITSVEISEGITTIGDRAFYGCSNLLLISIPESVTYIGEDAFGECYSVWNLHLGENSYAKQYFADNNIPYKPAGSDNNEYKDSNDNDDIQADPDANASTSRTDANIMHQILQEGTRSEIIDAMGVFSPGELIKVSQVQSETEDENQRLRFSFGDVENYDNYNDEHDEYYYDDDYFDDDYYVDDYYVDDYYGDYWEDWMTSSGAVSEAFADLDSDGTDEYVLVYLISEQVSDYDYMYLNNQWYIAIYEPDGNRLRLACNFPFSFSWRGENCVKLLETENGMDILVSAINYWDGGGGGISTMLYGYNGENAYIDMIMNATVGESSYIAFGPVDVDSEEQIVEALNTGMYEASALDSCNLVEGQDCVLYRSDYDEEGEVFIWEDDTSNTILNPKAFVGFDIVVKEANKYGIVAGYSIEKEGEEDYSYENYSLKLMGGNTTLLSASEGWDDSTYQSYIDIIVHYTEQPIINSAFPESDEQATDTLRKDKVSASTVGNEVSGGAGLSFTIDGADDWNSAYEQCVIGDANASLKSLYGNWGELDEPEYGIHDMDRNGIPELIAINGGSMGTRDNYVFTYEEGRIVYIGDAGFCWLFYHDSSEYPGLFCEDEAQGYYMLDYYYIKDGTVCVEQVKEVFTDDETENILTDDQALLELAEDYNNALWLEPMTTDTIRQVGWDVFVKGQLSIG